MPRKVKILISILIIFAAGFSCYANSLGAPFLWDDEVLVLRNQYIRDIKYIGHIFTSGHFQGGGEGGSFYRPLQILSYLIDYNVWKLNPFGYHLTNVILHCLVALAVYFIISRICENSLVGFFSALFFAVHPVHTEAVTYISGRADPLVCMFLLFAFLCLLKISPSSSKRYLYWIFASIFYILALLSRESALIFMFLLILYLISFKTRKELPFWLMILFSFLLISTAYIFIRVFLIDFTKSRSLSLIAQAPTWQRLLTIPKIYALYLGLLTLPIHLHMERHFLLNNLGEPYFWLGIALILLTAWWLVFTYRKRRKLFFFSGWFIVTLIPVLNIVPLNATAAEHWLYLPAVGFWALAVTLLWQLQQNKKRLKIVILVFLCIFLLFYSLRSAMRNRQWQDALGLYDHDLKYSKQSFLLHNNLGVELFRQGKLKQAGEHFYAAFMIRPNYATCRNNLGVILENQGKQEEAIAQFKAAIGLNDYILAYANLGRIYLKQKKPSAAQAVLEKGASLYPFDAEINYYLGIAYYWQKDFTQAKEQFQKVEQLSPGYKNTQTYLQALQNR